MVQWFFYTLLTAVNCGINKLKPYVGATVLHLKSKKFEYKWVILVICFLMNFVCLGFSGGRALFLSAITKALNIDRSLFALNETFRYVTIAVINVFFGGMLYRFGIRKMILVGIIAWVLSLTLSVLADNVITFYIAGIISGIGQALTTTTITGSIIRRWFKKNIGIYTGIVLAANGVGSALAAQVTSPLINDPVDPFGYRNAYIFVGVCIAIVGVIILIFLREKPENEQLEPVAPQKRRGVAWHGILFKSATKRPYFYIAAVNAVLTGFLLQGISGIYAAHMTDKGMDPTFVATVASVYAVMLTVSKILVGILYDRMGLRVVMIACQCCAVLCFIAMLLLGPSPVGQLLCFAFAILYALSLPLETLVIPLIVNDLFGSVNYDKFLGLFAALNYLGYSASAPLVNLCFDITGSYDVIFIPFAILMTAACFVFQFVITSANKERKKQQVQ